MRELISKTFSSQGRRAGGSWKQNTEEWWERKQTLPEYDASLGPRIGFFTGALYRSFTDEEDPNSFVETGPNFVNVGSELDYAEAFDYDRPIRITQNDSLKLGEIIREYMITAWEEGAVGAPVTP